MIATGNVTLAVLAGGESSRMGRPKSQIVIRDEPILSYLLDRFRWDGPTTLVTAPGHEAPPGSERFGSQVSDPVSKLGPLRGVLTALEYSQTDLILITTVDMPGIGRSQLDWLVQSLVARDDLDVLMPARLSSGRMSCEPFPSAWRKTSLPLVSEILARGESSARAMSRQDRGSMILAPQSWPASIWTNLNTPADLELFLRSVGTD